MRIGGAHLLVYFPLDSRTNGKTRTDGEGTLPASNSMAVLLAAFVGLLAAVNNGANAQTYPSGPVKVFVPVPAGGVTDTITPAQCSQLIQDDRKHWGALVKAVGAKLE